MGKLFKRALTFRVAKHALGKYIVGIASLMHLIWAAILMLDVRAANATALSVLFALFNSRVAVIAVLLFIAFLGLLFLDLRLRAVVGVRWLAILLVPQQLVLWLSAGAGIYATIIQRYADGVIRSWAHIAADQTAMILMAGLYTIAVFESMYPPIYSEE